MNVGEGVEKKEASCTVGENVKLWATMESNMTVPSKKEK